MCIRDRAERESRDERALEVDRRKPCDARAEDLDRDRGSEEQRGARRRDVETEPDHSVEEERRQGRDLEDARVAAGDGCESHSSCSGIETPTCLLYTSDAAD